MAQHGIKVNYNLPDDIEITLIRADYYDLSHGLRIAFEVFLAVLSAVIGYLLTKESRVFSDYLLLVALVGIVFFLGWYWTGLLKSSRRHTRETEDIPFDKYNYACNIRLDQKETVDNAIGTLLPGVEYSWKPNRVKKTHITFKLRNIGNKELNILKEYFVENSIENIMEVINPRS